MTDWTTARVVRDRDGDLWFRDRDAGWMNRWRDYLGADIWLDEDRGPLVPILDADGLPMVRTVGDLTARHIGQQVTAEGHTGVLSELLARDGMVQLAIDDADGPAWFPAAALNTTCEVLP